MRRCESCNRQDEIWTDPETREEIHEVRALYRVAKLINTPAHPEGQIEPKFLRDGWKLKRDGKNIFRYKILCRLCIEKVYDGEARRREYEDACKKARGIDDRTYSQILAMQSAS